MCDKKLVNLGIRKRRAKNQVKDNKKTDIE
jgi:hypothetical protein